MIFISHRGNIDGPNQKDENRPEYINAAIESGFDAEVDIRLIDSKFYLGHYEAQYKIPFAWIMHHSKHLWLHCKNYEALVALKKYRMLNCFWHQKDDVTLTSKGFLWAYPGMQPIHDSIAVLPEILDDDVSQAAGVCSDMVGFFKRHHG